MNTYTPFLSTQALAIGYTGRNQPKRSVAESLALDLWPGQLVCLLGPNGAGKSTLMRTLAGLQPPLSGQILLNGQPLVNFNSTELAQRLSLVLAERVEAGNLSVHELIALGRTPHTGWLGKLTESDLAQVHKAITATGTQAFAYRRIHQLSDGERQKVMLARALAQDTDLILLDEPTAHLDLPNRVEMMRLLHQLTRQTQKAILLSTHELDLALQMADKLWLLDHQGNMAVGAPEDLVLNGTFEATFAKAGFYFDRTTGAFMMHPDEQGPAISLLGDERLLFWTRRALQREGFRISQENSVATVEATYQNGYAVWRCEQTAHANSFVTIENLLHALKSLIDEK